VSEAGWPQRIVELVKVKEQLDEADTEGLWEYRLPGVRATRKQLDEIEAQLGEKLDAQLREFLLHAGGWPALFQAIDLFGPEELAGGPALRRARELLARVDDAVFRRGGVHRDSLLPIGSSSDEDDVIAIARPGTEESGQVFWYAGDEVDRFPDFDAFFAAMVAYNRREAAMLSGDESGG